MAAQRYYLYYKQTGSGNPTVGKPSGYSQFLHNPDAKRMSFVLPENQGRAQEQIGKFIQDFQRLNAGKFSIANAVTGVVSTPTPPVPKPPVGGVDPKPSTTVITNSGKTEPEKKDNNSFIILIAIGLGLVFVPKFFKKRKR
ncbi:hypothetical protein [Leptospira borgpetersenii]|uniref:Uncharacterized protein n=2 Tax=Leptospira borgpetersenii TaxID=174 RepID=M3HI45_LEPBO|nr:hypothetical protein [Leptospira borgpetersenii]EMF97785.1 hypothetical protein LEP1GSC123_0907 [Leptospira borgpetersenii str. 200701203]EKP11863.1 hypothetical protein LEP1GSC128_1014 [Leptospira borgpetersenii str. 200801926]ENO62966.1 hypothetical protein LEP1GSC191_4194 [Leptospira borgpetersenii serovar Mini str. 201000851]MBE8401332.1 hypothetical protein [Leptospira borgpetersenii serovar Tarassovi]MBE8404333.1 hypothetical protein [Leptospira borgpetersenii serovar Tarassovi]